LLDDHDNLIEIAAGYAAHQAETSLAHLLAKLDINRSHAGWQDRLSPFAMVWSAMIAVGGGAHATMSASRWTLLLPFRHGAPNRNPTS
jgi:hypothetical protein